MTFRASEADRRKSSTLLRLRTLSNSAYQRYRAKTTRWLSVSWLDTPSIVIHGKTVKVERFAFHHSQLFDRDYLVAFVSRDAIRAANPDSDASAAVMTNPKLPPVVIMPEKSRHRRASALSIIEHEIVHINQILAGASPELPKKRDVRTRIKYFADAMRTEYEANLLQLVRWPALYPTDVGLSLDHWCMLRGYADALEATVRLAARDNLTQTQAIRLVEGLETELHTGARRLGIDKAQLQWFVDRWPAHTATAITRVAAEFPIVKSTIAFAAIVSWWKARWGTASATVHEAVPAEHAPSRRHAPRSSKGRRAPAR